MAKKQKFNSFDPFEGITKTEQIEGQESLETLEGGRYMPDPPKTDKKEKHTAMEPKKKGRPKLNRELKKRISFTILPSLYEQASKIAYQEGKSVSELVSDLLREYIEKH